MKKNLILWVMVASLFATSYSSNAAPSDNGAMTVTVARGAKAKTLIVSLVNLQNKTTHISIQNLDGKIGIATKVESQNEYAAKLNLDLMPQGDYILLVENDNSQYIRAFSVGNADVALYDTERASKSEAQYVGFNGGTGLSQKLRMINGVVNRLENTSSNINFLFVETADRSYFQFFSISDKGVAIENAQTIKKEMGKKGDNKMAVLSQKSE